MWSYFVQYLCLGFGNGIILLYRCHSTWYIPVSVQYCLFGYFAEEGSEREKNVCGSLVSFCCLFWQICLQSAHFSGVWNTQLLWLHSCSQLPMISHKTKTFRCSKFSSCLIPATYLYQQHSLQVLLRTNFYLWNSLTNHCFCELVTQHGLKTGVFSIQHHKYNAPEDKSKLTQIALSSNSCWT